MYEEEKREIIWTALEILRYGLITLTGGNISVRLPDGTFLATPSGMLYESMEPEDIVHIRADKTVIAGRRRPTSDLDALLYIFREKPEVNAVIHTHQPYATAVGLVEEKLPACTTGIADTAQGDVPVTPFTISSDEGMGIQAVACCGKSQAVILGNHGVIGFGKTLFEALETVVYLEEGAKTYLAARAVGSVKLLTEEQIRMESMDYGNYGQ